MKTLKPFSGVCFMKRLLKAHNHAANEVKPLFVSVTSNTRQTFALKSVTESIERDAWGNIRVHGNYFILVVPDVLKY